MLMVRLLLFGFPGVAALAVDKRAESHKSVDKSAPGIFKDKSMDVDGFKGQRGDARGRQNDGRLRLAQVQPARSGSVS